MQMQHKFKETFITLLIILFVITECLSTLRHNHFLGSNISSFPHQQTSLRSKAENVIRTNLQHTKRMLFAKNDNEDSKNEETIREYGKGKISGQGIKIWDQWGNWSSCSVTCGIGKLTRWRHCIDGSCAVGEKKAQLKTCTLAAC